MHGCGPLSIIIGCVTREDEKGTMKRLWATTRAVLFIIAAGVAGEALLFSAQAQAQTAFETEALVRLEVKGPIQNLGLPIHAHLRDGAGNDYALVIAPLKHVADTGLSYQILDDPASHGTYYLARERRKGARQAAAGFFTILHDDGRCILVKGSPSVADELSLLGFDIKMLPAKPMILRVPFDIKMTTTNPITSRTPEAATAQTLSISYDSRVKAMIDQVRENTLYDELGKLTGEAPVTIGSSTYTITTRATSSGTPIQKATQYAYERMETMGLAVSYQHWSTPYYSSRNVVGTKPGKTKPSEIVLVTAHLDDVPESHPAPGADDNASGSTALLMAAEIMASGTFERTLRFVFFTGEEQGILGSNAYAAAAFAANENIVAVYNMDMIAWNTTGSPPTLRLHTRTYGNPGYHADMAIAGTFSDTIATYDLLSFLTPVITSDGEWASDHSSFWDMGYAAILAIEDDYDDFTPYYHTANDTRQRLSLTYFTNFTKASVGTAAHLALPAGLSAGGMTLAVTREGLGKGLVKSIPKGIDCGGTCDSLFPFGEEVALTATPSAGSTFAGWSGGGCQGIGTCIVGLKTNITVAATFTKDPVGKGDINYDGQVNLTDAIIAIQRMTNIVPYEAVYWQADVNGDGKIGLPEAIYILQKVAGLR